MYKRQIYQIAESNRIEKIYSIARIESNRIETFFARIGMLYSIDALCVCFAIFFVFMEVFCFFMECKLHLPPYCLYTQRHSQLPRIRLLWLFCILKKNKVKVRPNSSTDYISQSEIAGSFGYKLRPGDTSASLLGLGLRTVEWAYKDILWDYTIGRIYMLNLAVY